MTGHDVVVVGAGAGGAACAWGLASAGLSVLLLDAGPEFSPTDYPSHRPDWERIESPDKPGSRGIHAFAPMQKLSPAHDHLRSWNHISGLMVEGDARRGVAYQHVRGIGGSTLHFDAESHRLLPAAMTMRSQFGVGADWPFPYAELEPYYITAETLSGVAGAADPARPRSAPYPLEPHAPGYASRLLTERTRHLGRTWRPNPRAILSRAYDGRPGCNYCAQCNRGCPRRDKGSVDVTYVPKAIATGRCRVLSGAEVTGLSAGPDNRIRALTYRDSAGQTHEVKTRCVVVAAGAIETPRLLLLSAGPHAAGGVANEQGLVGRNLLETLHWTTCALHPESLGTHRGLPSDIICWDFNAPDAIPGVVGGCRFAPVTASMLLTGPVSYATRVVEGWGRSHREKMQASFGNAIAIGAIGESLPDPGTYVDLAPDLTDPHGLPAARIHSHLDDMAIGRIEFMAAECRRMVAAMGAGAPFEEFGAYDMFSSTHVFGTARMGTDPATSVVNAHGRAHHCKNLFISDASVFPSSGGGEAPSLTIQALALRTARAIRDAAARREI